MKRILSLIIAVVLLTGCNTLFKSTVTLTQVVDSAMKQWASLSVNGLTTPEFDAKVVVAHDNYRAAAAAAQSALIAYKNTGDQESYLKAFEAARAAAGPVVDLIVKIISPARGVELQTDLAKANKL